MPKKVGERSSEQMDTVSLSFYPSIYLVLSLQGCRASTSFFFKKRKKRTSLGRYRDLLCFLSINTKEAERLGGRCILTDGGRLKDMTHVTHTHTHNTYAEVVLIAQDSSHLLTGEKRSPESGYTHIHTHVIVFSFFPPLSSLRVSG